MTSITINSDQAPKFNTNSWAPPSDMVRAISCGERPASQAFFRDFAISLPVSAWGAKVRGDFSPDGVHYYPVAVITDNGCFAITAKASISDHVPTPVRVPSLQAGNDSPTKSLGYVSSPLASISAAPIDDAFSDIPGRIPASGAHMTLVYDRRNSNRSIGLESEVYALRVTGCRMMGNPESEYYACVLTLETAGTTAERRHNALIAHGFEHSCPEFSAHVSIKYCPTTEEFEQIKAAAEGMKGSMLYFAGEKFALTKS